MPSQPDWVKKLVVGRRPESDLLTQERSTSNLDTDQLAEYLFTKDTLQKRERILNTLVQEPVLDKSKNYFQGRDERIQASLAKAKRLRQLKLQHGWTDEEYAIAYDLLSEPTPYGLHGSMFLKVLREQGTPEQHKLFLEGAEDYKIIGCYAQTELGHGSNVRGLETTATWNQSDKTFTLHSPTLTASKWWIGSLGKVANHAVVMAQLVIDGKNFGPHPFVVHIRDFKTHEPLENVHVGDIGPKFGYNTMDNGFLLLNNVKVPHANMLARFSRVDPQSGKYSKPTNPALVYGTLTWVRSNIVLQSGSVLARGVTIAVRYCAVRRQFQDIDAKRMEGENPVLNYTMVQYRLLPLLAATFALHFTGRGMIRMYEENQKRMADTSRALDKEQVKSSADLLADLHATSCALKAYGSTLAGEGLEVCRRACGGHGYSSFSGIGTWYADYLPTLTWEGDNYMLSQQVCRYLLKSARAVLSGKAGSNDTTRILKDYVSRRDTGAAFDILSSDADLVKAFAWRLAYQTFEAAQHRDEEKRSWNSLLVDFHRLSKAHAQYMVVKSFFDTLEQDSFLKSDDGEIKTVLRKLFRLYALHTLENEASEFFSSAATTLRQIQLVRKAVMNLLEQVRPHAVRLVDAWSFSDWQLDSSLGRYDGNVYEDLFHRASELNPLNKVVFDPYPESSETIKSKL